jgi:hypothetical protein
LTRKIQFLLGISVRPPIGLKNLNFSSTIIKAKMAFILNLVFFAQQILKFPYKIFLYVTIYVNVN